MHCHIPSTQITARPRTGTPGKSFAEGRTMGREGGKGEVKEGTSRERLWFSHWGTELRVTSGALLPSPDSSSTHLGDCSGPLPRFWGWQADFPCLGTEADVPRTQTSALNSSLTQSLRCNRERSRLLDMCSPVIANPFSKEGMELCLYWGSLYSRKHQSRTK